MQPSDELKTDDRPREEKRFQFSLRRLLVVMTGMALVLTGVGFGIRELYKPPLAVRLRREVERSFPKGTPHADIEKWVASKKVYSTGSTFWGSLIYMFTERWGGRTPLEMAGLRPTEVSHFVRADFSEESVVTRVYFFFDGKNKLIKAYVDEMQKP